LTPGNPAAVGGDERPCEELLDRENDLVAIDEVLAAVGRGAGAVMLIEGPAGIGKTALLRRLRQRADRLGFSVQTARGGELERGFGFGIVHQLLETVLAGADAAERARLLDGAARLAEPVFTDISVAEDSGSVAFATLHGLYWLVANIAERRPLVLAVDDAHWADEPSLRFLLHLAHRLAGLAILVVLTVRTGADRKRADLAALMLEAGSVLRPRPLSQAAVASLVRAGLGEDASTQLCRACADATGGNPFLLSELLGEFRREARPIADINPAAVDRVAPERISKAVLLRVGALDPEASALARSIAVLGQEARLNLCSELAGVDIRKAATLITGLVDLAVLTPGEPSRFIHPIVRTAIYEDLSAAERADLHARAARLLARRHADPGAIGVHLLATTPTGDPEVLAMLWESARSALAGGAPDAAAELLRRALDEPPPDADRPAFVLELGNAEHETGNIAATRHLREAIETTADPITRARAVTALAWTTHPDAARQREQLPIYERAATDVRPHDPELALQLEAARLGALLLNPDLPARFEDEADRFGALPAFLSFAV
jgi:AAA ATPase domain